MMNKTIGLTIFSLMVSAHTINAQENPKAADSTETKLTETTQKLYKVIDKHGRVSYSDIPSKNAVEIKTDLVPNVEMRKSNVSLEDLVNRAKTEGQSKIKPAVYSELKFVNLINDSVVRNNGSTVTLTASITPALKKGDTINFFLDGKLMKSKGSLSVTFNQVNYGPHKASFIVMSSDRKPVAKSGSVQFHLLHTVRKKAR